MRKLNQFINFDAKRFFSGKQLVFKEGKFVNSTYFTGCKITLLIDRDDTIYADASDKGVNTFESLVISVPNVDESFLKQFHIRQVVDIEIASSKVYVNQTGGFSSMAVSFTGMVKPREMNQK